MKRIDLGANYHQRERETVFGGDNIGCGIRGIHAKIAAYYILIDGGTCADLSRDSCGDTSIQKKLLNKKPMKKLIESGGIDGYQSPGGGASLGGDTYHHDKGGSSSPTSYRQGGDDV